MSHLCFSCPNQSAFFIHKADIILLLSTEGNMCLYFVSEFVTMASRLFSTLTKIGIGLAVAGGVANNALYNGNVC